MYNIINKIKLQINHEEFELLVTAEFLERISIQELADAYVDLHLDELKEELIEQLSASLLPF